MSQYGNYPNPYLTNKYNKMSEQREPTEREKINAARTFQSVLENKQIQVMHQELTHKTRSAMGKIYGGCFERDTTLATLVPNGMYYQLPELVGTLLKDLAKAKGVELTSKDYLEY